MRAIAFSITLRKRGEGFPYDTNIEAQIKHSSLVYCAAIAKYAAIGGCEIPPPGDADGYIQILRRLLPATKHAIVFDLTGAEKLPEVRSI